MDSLTDLARQLWAETKRPYFGEMPSIFREREWVKDPEYMKNKGIGRLTVNLTPDEYYKLSTEGFNFGREGEPLTVENLWQQRNDKRTKELINKLRFNVDSIDRPSLNYGYDYRYQHPSFSQEGLHRMQAGKKLGLKYIPTEVFYDLDIEKPITEKFSQYSNRVIPQTFRLPSLSTLGKFGLGLAERATIPLAIYQGLSQPTSRDEDYFLKGGIEYNDYQY